MRACAPRVIQWSRTNGPCNPEFFSKPGLVEVLRSIRVQIRLLGAEDAPITIAPPPVNVDPRYPRLQFKGTGVRMASRFQDDTVVDGHVDRYLDGTVQWTFVSFICLACELSPRRRHDAGLSIWKHNLDVGNHRLRQFFLANVMMDLGLMVYSLVQWAARLGWLVPGLRRSIWQVRSRIQRVLSTILTDNGRR